MGASGCTTRRGTEAGPDGPQAGASGAAEPRPAVAVKTWTTPPCLSREIRWLLPLHAQLGLKTGGYSPDTTHRIVDETRTLCFGPVARGAGGDRPAPADSISRCASRKGGTGRDTPPFPGNGARFLETLPCSTKPGIGTSPGRFLASGHPPGFHLSLPRRSGAGGGAPPSAYAFHQTLAYPLPIHEPGASLRLRGEPEATAPPVPSPPAPTPSRWPWGI